MSVLLAGLSGHPGRHGEERDVAAAVPRGCAVSLSLGFQPLLLLSLGFHPLLPALSFHPFLSWPWASLGRCPCASREGQRDVGRLPAGTGMQVGLREPHPAVPCRSWLSGSPCRGSQGRAGASLPAVLSLCLSSDEAAAASG